MQNNYFTVATYNVGGLPKKIDLLELPWYLRWIAYGYKIFKGTSEILINQGSSEGSKKTELLKEDNIDLIGVQEDFNHHQEILSVLGDSYSCGTWTGGFWLLEVWKKIDFHLTRLPSWKIDGLELFFKKFRVNILKEEIIQWNSSFGYFKNGNDSLMNKGFRYFQILLDDIIPLDLYILHMDADFYSGSEEEIKGDIKARKNQFTQLSEYIKKNLDDRNVIVLGDFNSLHKNRWDSENFDKYFPQDFQDISRDEDVDKIFYYSNPKSQYRIEVVDYEIPNKYSGLSDHLPLLGKFIYYRK